MKIQIKSWIDQHVIYECEAENLKEAVEKAVKEIIDLRGANLRGADLRWADLHRVEGKFIFNYGVKLKVVEVGK